MNKDFIEDLQLKEQLIVDLNLDRQKKETLEKEIKELRINLKQYQKDKDIASLAILIMIFKKEEILPSTIDPPQICGSTIKHLRG